MADLRRRGQLAARLSQSLNRDSEFDKEIRYVFAAPEALDEPRWKALLLESKFTDRLRAIFLMRFTALKPAAVRAPCFTKQYGCSREPMHRRPQRLMVQANSLQHLQHTPSRSMNTITRDSG